MPSSRKVTSIEHLVALFEARVKMLRRHAATGLSPYLDAHGIALTREEVTLVKAGVVERLGGHKLT